MCPSFSLSLGFVDLLKAEMVKVADDGGGEGIDKKRFRVGGRMIFI